MDEYFIPGQTNHFEYIYDCIDSTRVFYCSKISAGMVDFRRKTTAQAPSLTSCLHSKFVGEYMLGKCQSTELDIFHLQSSR